ncbi:OFA family MFS transporter [Weissella soli]|uniref:OFA family oxalate/formate antiporter-like MFS transporter n=1 Tax=Weissella soli TaxID=155866 RepID=A0A288Q7Z3_9LACO|nr:OFA family MFS transporter [Weissella soli]AOT56024.1 Monocarboxylate transporter [Weissella soli]NKY82485.1 OFA family MFS transporter [Weissella soli]RDL11598.1 OFA family oxalate/formate antiporter-like MFS transporter [Weissella soli]GEN93175.1 MFS transporter [Weissella soli]
MNNKWMRAALPALLIHSSIGTVYCWSIFKQAIADYTGQPTADVEWAFSLAIFFLGMSAAVLGHFVEQDIKKSALLSTVFLVIGMAGTGLSIHAHSLVGIYLFYGIIMGIGLGIGYLTPVKTLMLWFKDNKGLGTGLAVAGFGLAKMVYSPIMFKLQQSIGLWQMFVILAAVFLVTMTLGMVLIKKPDDWIEEPLVNKFQPVALLKNRSFIGIWLMFYLNITCGLAVISQEKDIMGSLVNGNGIAIFSATAITTVVSVDAFFNAAGRIGFATLSDHLRDRNTVYKIIFVLSAALALATFFMPSTAAWLAIVLVMTFFTINAGYGGGFSALPPLLSDRFGMKAISKIHGLALSAWAIAGLSGNQLASFITNGLHLQYQSMFIVIAILYVVALGIAYVMVKPQQTLVY